MRTASFKNILPQGWVNHDCALNTPEPDSFQLSKLICCTPYFIAELLRCEILRIEEYGDDVSGRRLQQFFSGGVELAGRIIYLVVSDDLQTIAVETAEDIRTVLDNLVQLQELLAVALPEDVVITATNASVSSNIEE
jgi:hypothetical protein